MTAAIRKAVAVRFGSSERTYDYWTDFPVSPGQHVVVPTRRGTATVVVTEVKDHSDMAMAAILSVVDDEAKS